MSELLIVDDHSGDGKRYRAFLEPDGHRVTVCTSSSAALSIIESPTAEIGLAIVLWELAGSPTAFELIKRLARVRPNLPLIAVTGHLDRSRAATAEALGARDFLLKPLDGERLRRAVERLLCPQVESPLFRGLKRRLIGDSKGLGRTLQRLAEVIPQLDANVLLVGESGTGKELLARAVHELGPAPGEPWVPVNVSAIPSTLLESHLFGSEAGAYTDAKVSRAGYFEECGCGTLFLDEIGELEFHLQAKLLRVIEDRRFRRLGSNADKRFAARLVTATNRDLVGATRRGMFRQDLYYRIATQEVHVPPLRDRGDDLWLLVEYFLKKFGGDSHIRLGREAKCLLSEYTFPGNIRELEDVIQGAVLRCDGEEILPYHLPIGSLDKRSSAQRSSNETTDVVLPERLFQLGLKEATDELTKALDREYLPRLLKSAHNKPTVAAKMAGVDKNTFKARWQRAGLEPFPWQE